MFSGLASDYVPEWFDGSPEDFQGMASYSGIAADLYGENFFGELAVFSAF